MPAAAPRTITPTLARRLAVTRQRLAGPRPAAGADGMMAVVRDLGCLQLDPIAVVARSHLLVLLSRLGPYDPAHLDALLWQERALFEYWAHCASIVLTEDYPLHRPLMTAYATRETEYSRRLRAWVAENASLRAGILARLAADGPLLSKQLQAESGAVAQGWHSTGWTSGRNVSRMLDHLWITGEIMVAGRSGIQKQWDLAARCLPAWAPTEPLPAREVVRRAAQQSLRALGVARARHIQTHFIRGRYPGLGAVLDDLEAEGRIVRVAVEGEGRRLPGPWYLHAADLPLLDALAAGDWAPRTALLSPFDNLICDRRRAALLFDFDFRIEIYTPKAQRTYGYYVLPILHGDRLIGRLDPSFDRRARRLTLHAVHAEADAPTDETAGPAVAGAIAELAGWLGAREISLPAGLPPAWQRPLRALA